MNEESKELKQNSMPENKMGVMPVNKLLITMSLYRTHVIYNSQFCCAIVVMTGIFSRRVTSESRTTAKESLFSALIGIFGCDFIVSGLMGLPFSYTRKSRWGPVEMPVEPT